MVRAVSLCPLRSTMPTAMYGIVAIMFCTGAHTPWIVSGSAKHHQHHTVASAVPVKRKLAQNEKSIATGMYDTMASRNGSAAGP